MMRSIGQCNPKLIYKSLISGAHNPPILYWVGTADYFRERLPNCGLLAPTPHDPNAMRSAIQQNAFVRQTSSLSTAKEDFPREIPENRKSAIL
jgi:hypothetical protein